MQQTAQDTPEKKEAASREKVDSVGFLQPIGSYPFLFPTTTSPYSEGKESMYARTA
jgi:hypothetical protein